MFTYVVAALITLVAQGQWQELQLKAVAYANSLEFSPAEYGALSLPAEEWAASGWAARFVERFAAYDHRLSLKLSALRELNRSGIYAPSSDLMTCQEKGEQARERAELFLRVHFRVAHEPLLPQPQEQQALTVSA